MDLAINPYSNPWINPPMGPNSIPESGESNSAAEKDPGNPRILNVGMAVAATLTAVHTAINDRSFVFLRLSTSMCVIIILFKVYVESDAG